MVFAEYYVNICEPFGCGGHIYYFQTNCRGGPRLIYYLKNDQATMLFFLFFFFLSESKVEREWCTNSKMHCGG